MLNHDQKCCCDDLTHKNGKPSPYDIDLWTWHFWMKQNPYGPKATTEMLYLKQIVTSLRKESFFPGVSYHDDNLGCFLFFLLDLTLNSSTLEKLHVQPIQLKWYWVIFSETLSKARSQRSQVFSATFQRKKIHVLWVRACVLALQNVTGGEIGCTIRLHGKQHAADFFLKNHAQRHPRYIYVWTWIDASKDIRRLKDPEEIWVCWKFVAWCWLWRRWMSSEPGWFLVFFLICTHACFYCQHYLCTAAPSEMPAARRPKGSTPPQKGPHPTTMRD